MMWIKRPQRRKINGMEATTKKGMTIAFWGVLVVVFLRLATNQQSSSPTAREQEQQQVRSLCASLTPTQEAEALSFIYKMDGGYMVYVQPSWYALKIDEKQAVAAYVARCKLSGSARFLDSRTGKLLARWGEN